MISYLLTTINRFDITPSVTLKNKSRAGHYIREFIITDNASDDARIIRWGGMAGHKFIRNDINVGNPQSFNKMMDLAHGDLIVIAGNDILLERNWLLQAIKVMNADPKVAIVGFGGEGVEGVDVEIGGVHCVRNPIGTTGTWVIRKSNLKKLGYFATFSKYGYWDGDYCNRVRAAGMKDVYIKDINADHLGADHGEDTRYRKMKDVEAKRAWPHIKDLASRYTATAHYLSKDNKLINISGKAVRSKKKTNGKK